MFGLLSLPSCTGMPHRSVAVVWCGVVWCGVVWSGVVWCGVVWCGVVWCSVVWCGVVWSGVVWCGVVWCGVVWCGSVVWCSSSPNVDIRCLLAIEPILTQGALDRMNACNAEALASLLVTRVFVPHCPLPVAFACW